LPVEAIIHTHNPPRIHHHIMRVFVTGASGWIGRAVVPELIKGGHKVIGLARSDSSAEKLLAAGAEVLRGSIEDHESLRKGAAAADGVIHLAFIHDFTQYDVSCEKDCRAIDAIGEVLTGTGKPFVVTSATLILSDDSGRTVTEEDAPNTALPNLTRAAGEQVALAFTDKNVRTSIIRLPPTVHGTGDNGFMTSIVGFAKKASYAGYVGEGANRWPAVHVHDAARLYRLALEKAPAGSKWHCVAEEGIPFRDVASAIGTGLSVEVGPQTADKFGYLGFAVPRDNPTSSEITKKTLCWIPKEIGLLADIETNYCKRAD